MRGLNKKTIIMLITVATLTISVVGCGNKSNNTNNKNKTEVQSTVNKPAGQDKKLTNKIQKESIVLDGNVYPDGDYMCGTMIIKDNAKKEEIEKVVNEYADKIKAKYKDKKVNVQAVQNGKNVANVKRK